MLASVSSPDGLGTIPAALAPPYWSVEPSYTQKSFGIHAGARIPTGKPAGASAGAGAGAGTAAGTESAAAVAVAAEKLQFLIFSSSYACIWFRGSDKPDTSAYLI